MKTSTARATTPDSIHALDIRAMLRSVKEKRERVFVYGLGLSGQTASKLLVMAGHRVVAIDQMTQAQILDRDGNRNLYELEELGVELHFGVASSAVADYASSVGLAILSPGVGLNSPGARSLSDRGIPLLGELEFGISLLDRPALIVTGSNGKSTTVALIHEMLKSSGFDSWLCGNFGIAATSFLDPHTLLPNPSEGTPALAVEASSYQLEQSHALTPRVGIWLNLSHNHLERHGTMEGYLAAKKRLFLNQARNDFAVLNSDDPYCPQMMAGLPGTVAFVGMKKGEGARPLGAHALIDYDPDTGRDQIEVSLPDGTQEIYSLENIRLIGLHNRYNIAAAVLAVRLFGGTRRGIQEALKNFVPLEHRLEFAGQVGGAAYYNDSKSTTVMATVAAVEALQGEFPKHALLLMIGGKSKAGSWEPLHQELRKLGSRLRALICFGGDAEKLAKIFKDANLDVNFTGTLEDGLRWTARHASKHDLVLFSPGCASYDQFNNFEERGRFFKDWLTS
jgi:UDP-N-acetylmuramoylalanine--D-glutamate ligase